MKPDSASAANSLPAVLRCKDTKYSDVLIETYCAFISKFLLHARTLKVVLRLINLVLILSKKKQMDLIGMQPLLFLKLLLL